MRNYIILFILCLQASKIFAQKTFHIGLYDDKIFDNSDHRTWLRFYNQPREEGLYIVYQDSTHETKRIWRYFYVDTAGTLIDKPEYSCYFDVVNVKDNANINFSTPCDPASVFLLNEVVAFSYHPADIDTVTVLSFPRNNGFVHPILKYKVFTEIRSFRPPGDKYQSIYLPYGRQSCDYDYELILKTRDTFRIANIVTHEYKPSKNVTGNFCTMYSYELNGKKVISNTIVLVKPGYEKEHSELYGINSQPGH